MRIIHILHGNVMIGGMEKFCLDLCNELSKEHDVMLLADECFKPYISDRVEYVPLDLKRSRNNPFFLYKLYKLFKKFNPDIFHPHKQKSILILQRLQKFLPVPFVATKQDMKIKKAFYGLKYAVTITEETRSTIRAAHIYKIYNGIPYNEPSKIKMSKSFNIVAIGGLKPVKGYDKLIDMMDRLPFDAHLTLVGDGILRESFEEQIERLGIKNRVTLVGFQDKVSDYIYSADLQIISSLSEGFSLAMVEGIFYAKVLVSTKVSGCTELLPDKLLFDIEDVTKKVTDVYENYASYEKEFKEVKDRYRNELTMEVCAKNYIDVYKKVLAQDRG